MLLTWMLFLQVGLYAATPNNIQPKNNQSKNIQPNSTQPGNSPSLKINSDRLKANEEIPDLTLGRVLGRPPIVIGLHLEGLEEGFMALRKEKNFEEVEKFSVQRDEQAAPAFRLLAERLVEERHLQFVFRDEQVLELRDALLPDDRRVRLPQ